MPIGGRVGPLRAAEGAHGGVRGRLRRFPTPNVHERIHAATADVVSARGYARAGVEEICAKAEVTPATFHEHFRGKDEAALSAVEALFDHIMADCWAASARFVDWPESVWAVLATLTDWGASEPALARLALVEMFEAGRPARDLMDSLMDAFCVFLAPGYELVDASRHPAGSLDAAVGSEMLAMLRGHLAHSSARTLPAIVPELTRSALAPFLGAAEAERFVAAKVAGERH
jgi:AcrR family transcriptional regulator